VNHPPAGALNRLMSDDPRDPDLPPRLTHELRSLYESPLAVPARVDAAILNRARAQMLRHRWRKRLLWAGAAAAAACVAIVTYVSIPTRPKPLDIVDALHLARQIEAGRGRDVNGDGRIDKADVDALAMMAVRLNGGVQ
jgi:hypothetical protein